MIRNVASLDRVIAPWFMSIDALKAAGLVSVNELVQCPKSNVERAG